MPFALLMILTFRLCYWSGNATFIFFIADNILSKSCVLWIQHFELHNIYYGLVCGKTLLGPERFLFLDLGIYHWLVVSGSHLMELQKSTRYFIKQDLFIFLILFLYSLVCEMNPPVTRSLIFVTLKMVNQKQKLFYKDEFLLFLSGLLCICFFPDWIFSVSLQLSWIASLGLLYSKNSTWQSLQISFLLTPVIGLLTPAQFFYNLVFTPLISHLLLPITFLFYFLAFLAPITNPLWDYFLQLLEFLPKTPANNEILTFTLSANWLYILFLHLILIGKKQKE